MTSRALPVDFFSPSARQAQAVDADIRETLQQSVAWCLEQAGLRPAAPQGWARPVDFGRYYDWLVALSQDDGAVTEAVRAQAQVLLERWQGSAAPREVPRTAPLSWQMTTLRAPWHDRDAVACLLRWFDLEPDNAMALVALDDEALAHASQQLRRALVAMETLMPDFLAEMRVITHEFVFARPSDQSKLFFGGASSFSLWGAMALNDTAHPHWWMYLPRLVHEYSHNLLFGLARNGPLVLNEPQERYPSPLRQQLRPMDGIFHAAFVSAREVAALRSALARLQDGGPGHAYAGLAPYLRQTVADSEQAFEDCLSVLHQHARLSELGGAVLRDTERAMRAGP